MDSSARSTLEVGWISVDFSHADNPLVAPLWRRNCGPNHKATNRRSSKSRLHQDPAPLSVCCFSTPAAVPWALSGVSSGPSESPVPNIVSTLPCRNEERRHQHHEGPPARGAGQGPPGGVGPPSRPRHPPSPARGGIVDPLAGGAPPWRCWCRFSFPRHRRLQKGRGRRQFAAGVFDTRGPPAGTLS